MSLPARQLRSRAARKAHLRVVPPPPRKKRAGKSRRSALFIVCVILAIAGIVFGLAATNAVLAQGSFRMEELAQQQELLARQNGELRLAVADLSSAERIASEARRLGLILPESSAVEVVYVRGTGGQPGDAP
ncbi:MAG: hypothetical protein WD276_11220 [Actinomycetota bacterium]